MSDTVENGSPGTVLSPFPFLELFGGKAKQAPGTFSSGKEIARFNRGADLVVFVGPISNDAFSLDLVFSQDFTVNGQEVNFEKLAPNGITNSNIGSSTPVSGSGNFTLAFPFAGTGIAIGTNSADGN
jgi:hypothetical protein